MIPQTKLIKQSSISAYLTSDYTTTTGEGTTFELIPVTDILSSKGSAFSITTDGTIKCNKNMEVLCSANLVLRSLKSAGSKQLQIRVNDAIKSYTNADISGGYRNLQSISKGFEVNAGDEISLVYSGIIGDVILGGLTYTTYLNIIEL